MRLLLLLPLLAPAPDSGYTALKAAIVHQRTQLGEHYARSTRKDTVIAKARAYLLTAIDAQFEHWKGTPWDFNGTTRVPREGTIACGYFVTTVLQDAGFDLPRYKWAQLAAEPMIRKVAPAGKAFSDRPVDEVEAWLRQQGDGLYAVGLDNHVGFIRVKSGEALFVHSNYYQREVGVMAEPLRGRNPLADSRYRYIGKLLDDAMLARWLEHRPLGP
ncbi:MAG: hypothetical protein JNL05_02445 [Flavobacteriales bacterium]|nr:hypothetical protein [Flavobacteriales bacterium]